MKPPDFGLFKLAPHAVRAEDLVVLLCHLAENGDFEMQMYARKTAVRNHFDGKHHEVLLNIFEIALPQLRAESNSEICHSNAVSILIQMATMHKFAVAIIETCLEKLIFEVRVVRSASLRASLLRFPLAMFDVPFSGSAENFPYPNASL